MIPLVNLAAAAVTAVVTFSSTKNILQTFALSRQDVQQQQQCSSSLSSSHATNSSLLFHELLQVQPDDTAETVVSKMKSMKRKDLVKLYFCSRGPKDISEVEGAWDGCLLENNGWVLTAVSALLSDRLFGRGRTWNGKQFGIANDNNKGINRFHPRKNGSKKDSNNPQSSKAETEHTFDVLIRPSKLGAKDSNSLVLDYTQHQSHLSLWRTMMDEIRIVPLEGDTRVLIGLGYMAWSGGRLNASPFLLFRDSKTAAPTV